MHQHAKMMSNNWWIQHPLKLGWKKVAMKDADWHPSASDPFQDKHMFFDSWWCSGSQCAPVPSKTLSRIITPQRLASSIASLSCDILVLRRRACDGMGRPTYEPNRSSITQFLTSRFTGNQCKMVERMCSKLSLILISYMLKMLQAIPSKSKGPGGRHLLAPFHHRCP